MKKFAFPLFAFLFCLSAYGQKDSLQNEILRYKDSREEIISKGRKLLLDKFVTEDFDKVREIRDYLIAEPNFDYMVFYPLEYWLLLYWTQDYEELTSSIPRIDSLEEFFSLQRIRPQPDLLFEKVLNKTLGSMMSLETSIGLADLEAVDKELLAMHLKYLVGEKTSPIITQNELNKLADDFLRKYPNSPYELFIRDYIRYVWVPAKWGGAFEFFSGYGWLTEDLATKFQNGAPMGVAFDIYYKNVVLYLRDYIGFSRTKQDIAYDNGTWEEGSQVRVYLPELTLGYVAVEGKRLKLAPFAGVSSTAIGATEYDISKADGLEDAGFSFTTTYTIGVNLDVKFGRSRLGATSSSGESYGIGRLRYAYNAPQFSRKYTDASGSMHYLTIGFGGFYRKANRDR